MEEGATGCCIGTWEGSETVIELICSSGRLGFPFDLGSWSKRHSVFNNLIGSP
ncbi:hypothetical protein FH972_027370 [Carpinus fangiana]|uniref:Uncharacterized protein n=1 Tax=Carpinus fangiana TaxID=176857 RepID=A0A5N6Q974_9ROSI|nr:hypothetical protein FH972_027370 [Carpinus fangiana]